MKDQILDQSGECSGTLSVGESILEQCERQRTFWISRKGEEHSRTHGEHSRSEQTRENTLEQHDISRTFQKVLNANRVKEGEHSRTMVLEKITLDQEQCERRTTFRV